MMDPGLLFLPLLRFRGRKSLEEVRLQKEQGRKAKEKRKRAKEARKVNRV